MSEPQLKQINNVLEGIISLLENGRLIPGERLPSERRLADLLGVSRANIRLALQKLEFHRIISTFPQSGSVFADYPASVLMNQIRDVMDTDNFDFASLVNVRVLLELEAIRLCASRRSPEDLVRMELALKDFEANMHTAQRDEKDFAFHMSIAKASHNPVIASLLLSISPEVLKYYRRYNTCGMPPEDVLKEHREMLENIRKGDASGAEKSLRNHFRFIIDCARQQERLAKQK